MYNHSRRGHTIMYNTQFISVCHQILIKGEFVSISSDWEKYPVVIRKVLINISNPSHFDIILRIDHIF